jgi:hypothetical protein
MVQRSLIMRPVISTLLALLAGLFLSRASLCLEHGERVRTGVIAGTHHFGHTQQGNSTWQIAHVADAITGGRFVSPVLHGLWQQVAEGHQVQPDLRRGSQGFSVNDAMRRNDALAGTPLKAEKVGGRGLAHRA